MVDINRSFVNSISYTDFVWLVNQWNVLPWWFTTLSKRINYWNVNNKSNLLEMACTTGFSIREMAKLTWCKWVGIDISAKSIESAIENQKRYWWKNKIKYFTKDAYDFESNKKFSHIVVWAALKFFPDQQKAIDKIVYLFWDEGYLLASPFYIEWELPKELKEKAKKVFDIDVTTESYKEIMDLYNKFEIIYEDRCELKQETEEDIRYYAKCTIDRAVKDLNIEDKDTYDAMFDRLVEIKTISNELRPYQRYSVLVLRYRKDIYPKRFIELF